MLTGDQVHHFIHQGFIKLENAFPATLAAEARSILWKDTGCLSHDPSTWKKPIIRLGEYGQEPFRAAVNTEVLHAAFDQLIGTGNWQPRSSIGTFPIRFPVDQDPGDTGWHVDSGFPGKQPEDFTTWRINIHSRGRALLMLFLFSDVGDQDAPTRIRVGSHLDVARLLLPAGEEGFSFMELADRLNQTAGKPEVSATGQAGTVYLCHPFLVHAAQVHRGTTPRFLAQPALQLKYDLDPWKETEPYSPLEISIRIASQE